MIAHVTCALLSFTARVCRITKDYSLLWTCIALTGFLSRPVLPAGLLGAVTCPYTHECCSQSLGMLPLQPSKLRSVGGTGATGDLSCNQCFVSLCPLLAFFYIYQKTLLHSTFLCYKNTMIVMSTTTTN